MNFLQTWQDYPCNRNKWSEDMYTFFPILPTSFQRRDRRGRGCMVVGFTTIYAISTYHLLTLWVRIPLRRGVFDTILCDKVCQLFAAGLCFFFSPGTLVSTTHKTDFHNWNIVESGIKHHNPNLSHSRVMGLYPMNFSLL